MRTSIVRLSASVRVLAVLLVCVLGAARAASAAPWVVVETPQNQAIAYQPFTISGWALDYAATANPGIDQVLVWAYPNLTSTEGGFSVGAATYGDARPDIGGQLAARGTSRVF